MPLRTTSDVFAAGRVLLGSAALALAGSGEWRLAAGSLAALSASAVWEARATRRRLADYRRELRHDPLTGVGNYRQLHERLHEVTSADPSRFALLTLDVDSFKQINDVHGHLEGDRLLQEVGRVLVENVRAGDVVARQGGDEFSVLLPEADVEGAALLAARIEQALASIEAADHQPVRASIGLAVFPQDGQTPDALLEKADLDLRTVKQRRRAGAESPAAA